MSDAYTKRNGIYSPSGMTYPAKASFDSAQSGPQMAKRFAYADNRSPNQENNSATRAQIRSRARYETQNSTYARGITLTIANDTIGTGPRLQLLSKNSNFNKQVEADFLSWTKAIDLAEKLRAIRIGRLVDGESIGEMVTNPGVNSEVQLDLALYEADYLVAPDFDQNSNTHYDGIDYDEYGNPTKYWLLDEHPDDIGFASLMPKPKAHNASAIIHYFRVDRAGQRRGISEMQSSLELFNMLRTYTKSTLDAAETAANHAGLLFTQAPPEQQADDVAAFYEENMTRNMMKALPFGWDFRQLKAEQPTTSYPAFKNEIINEIARCLNVPFNVAALNSSEYNYASGRLDHQAYFRSISVEQANIETTILNRLYEVWSMEYALLRGLDSMQFVRHNWHWDGFENIDPKKSAEAREIDLINNATTYAQVYADKGLDWEEQFEQRAIEKKKMESLGLVENTTKSTTGDKEDA